MVVVGGGGWWWWLVVVVGGGGWWWWLVVLRARKEEEDEEERGAERGRSRNNPHRNEKRANFTSGSLSMDGNVGSSSKVPKTERFIVTWKDAKRSV